jgi:hypothetical protein
MSSSEQGLEIFRNWQTHRTLLWFLSLEFSDWAHGPEVRVKVTSVEPTGVVLALESGDVEVLDLEGAEFDEAGPDESPFLNVPAESFVRFLEVRLPDGRMFVFAERRPE